MSLASPGSGMTPQTRGDGRPTAPPVCTACCPCQAGLPRVAAGLVLGGAGARDRVFPLQLLCCGHGVPLRLCLLVRSAVREKADHSRSFSPTFSVSVAASLRFLPRILPAKVWDARRSPEGRVFGWPCTLLSQEACSAECQFIFVSAPLPCLLRAPPGQPWGGGPPRPALPPPRPFPTPAPPHPAPSPPPPCPAPPRPRRAPAALPRARAWPGRAGAGHTLRASAEVTGPDPGWGACHTPSRPSFTGNSLNGEGAGNRGHSLCGWRGNVEAGPSPPPTGQRGETRRADGR